MDVKAKHIFSTQKVLADIQKMYPPSDDPVFTEIRQGRVSLRWKTDLHGSAAALSVVLSFDDKGSLVKAHCHLEGSFSVEVKP